MIFLPSRTHQALAIAAAFRLDHLPGVHTCACGLTGRVSLRREAPTGGWHLVTQGGMRHRVDECLRSPMLIRMSAQAQAAAEGIRRMREAIHGLSRALAPIIERHVRENAPVRQLAERLRSDAAPFLQGGRFPVQEGHPPYTSRGDCPVPVVTRHYRTDGAEIHLEQLPPVDTELLDRRRAFRDEVALLFRIPEAVLRGSPLGVTRSCMEQAALEYGRGMGLAVPAPPPRREPREIPAVSAPAERLLLTAGEPPEAP